MIAGLTRRGLIGHGCGCLISLGLGPSPVLCQPVNRRTIAGCAAKGDQVTEVLEQIRDPSGQQSLTIGRSNMGDADFDVAFMQGVAILSDTFGVSPGFGFFDGPLSDNAYALREPFLHKDDGTVLFGRTLLRKLMARQDARELAIMAVCAHEFGHIVAYKEGYDATLSPDPDQPFRSEQFADFMAGYFAGVRRARNSAYNAVVFATTLYELGDTVRGSHGTQDERVAAAEKGFVAAKRLALLAAARAGYEFAMSR